MRQFKKFIKPIVLVISGFLSIIFVIKAYWYFISKYFPSNKNFAHPIDFPTAGQFGDMFGMLNAFLSVLNISILTYSLINQMKANVDTTNALKKQLRSQAENKTFDTAKILATEFNSNLESIVTHENKSKIECLTHELHKVHSFDERIRPTDLHLPELKLNLHNIKKILLEANPRISIIKNLVNNHPISDQDKQLVRSIIGIHLTKATLKELNRIVKIYSLWNSDHPGKDNFKFEILIEFQTSLEWIHQNNETEGQN